MTLTTSSFSSVEKWMLQKINRSIGQAPIRLVLGRDEGTADSSVPPVATVVISNRKALAKLVLNPEVGFGDCYADGTVKVEGDLISLLESALRSMQNVEAGGFYSKLFSRWLDRIQANTLRGSARNISHHYDLSADFYKLWLDSRLVYTCAYFPSPSATLDEAQLAKMDYVCRKIRLQPEDKVVDAGCGWGALALHMAKHYGASVKAFNISKEQVLFARERAKEEGLSRQVEFIEDDYRNISGQFDAFVSVGMLEHVGAEHYEDLGRVIHRTIGDSGQGLLHFIGRNQARPFSPWIRKRIFPGAYVPALGEALDFLGHWNFSVLDVENLRNHYARTLEDWLARFEKSADQVAQNFGPEFVRAWRLYLAGSMAAFRVGTLQLFQVVFAGSRSQRIPWTRAHLYEQRPAATKESRWMHAMS
jgi:cyclopropane-fatty-acyl-phospholipid synthase